MQQKHWRESEEQEGGQNHEWLTITVHGRWTNQVFNETPKESDNHPGQRWKAQMNVDWAGAGTEQLTEDLECLVTKGRSHRNL